MIRGFLALVSASHRLMTLPTSEPSSLFVFLFSVTPHTAQRSQWNFWRKKKRGAFAMCCYVLTRKKNQQLWTHPFSRATYVILFHSLLFRLHVCIALKRQWGWWWRRITVRSKCHYENWKHNEIFISPESDSKQQILSKGTKNGRKKRMDENAHTHTKHVNMSEQWNYQ